jgi:hypothetical protein
MNILVNEINRAAKKVGLQLAPLSSIRTTLFWKTLQEKYDLKMDGQLWCQMQFSYNRYDPEGWRIAPDLISDWPAIMFFDPYKDVPVLDFSSKEDVLLLLEESFHFVFYLATPDLSRIVVFDDHECLRATG